MNSQVKNTKVNCNIWSYSNKRRPKAIVERCKTFLSYHAQGDLEKPQFGSLNQGDLRKMLKQANLIPLSLFDAQVQQLIVISGHLMDKLSTWI